MLPIIFPCISYPFELNNLLFFQGDPGIDSYIQGPKGETGRRGQQVRLSLFARGYRYTRERLLAGAEDLAFWLDQRRKPESKPVGLYHPWRKSSEC